MPKAKPNGSIPPPRLSATSSITELLDSSIIEALSGPELLVYLRLLRAVAEKRKATVEILNRDLYRDGRTAVKALRALEGMKLVRISYDSAVRERRQIEVVR